MEEDGAMPAYQRMMVGTDGSPTSMKAVKKAAELAHAAGAELIIVCAYTPIDSRSSASASDQLGADAYQIQGDNPAAEIVREAREQARTAGLDDDRVVTRAVQGAPVETLIRLVEEEKADLLVVGNRGLNSFASRLWGSVPGEAARRAPSDVLIVHTT